MHKRKLVSVFLLILAIVLPLAGCWDAADINDRDILTAIIVDKTDYGFAFYVEIPPINASTKSGEPQAPKKPVIVKAEGRTYAEARENMDRAMDKPIYLGAVQSVIFTERAAQYDIEEYLLRLRHVYDYRKTVHVVVTTDNPETLLNDIPENSQSVGFAIDDTLTSLASTGEVQHISLMDVLESLASPYKHYVLPTIALVNQEPAFTGYSVFSGGMKTGFIPADEAGSIILLMGKNARQLYTVPYRDSLAAIEVQLEHKDITAHWDGSRASFDMTLQFKGVLQNPEKNKPITDEDMEILQATLRAILEKEYVDMITQSQQDYHYDCFRLYRVFRITYPEEYKAMNWAEVYDRAVVYLSVQAKLRSTDLIDYNPRPH